VLASPMGPAGTDGVDGERQNLTPECGVPWALMLAATRSWLRLNMEIGDFGADVAWASTAYQESSGARMMNLSGIVIEALNFTALVPISTATISPLSSNIRNDCA
jgi:hypothetical protein